MDFLGLRAKLLLGISTLIAAYACFFALYFPNQQRDAANRALKQRAIGLSAVLANLVVPSVVAEDLGGADQLSDDLRASGTADLDISYITVLRPDGSLLASYRAEALARDVERAAVVEMRRAVSTEDHLHVSVPLRHESNLVGALTIGLSNRSVREAAAQGLRSALLVSALILVIGVILAYLVARSMARPLLAAALRLDDVATTLVSAARDQEASSAEEAAAVAETRRSMETLLDSAQQIADRSSEVLGNAERTATGTENIAERISNLNALSEKVAEILATIMQVADKADLLALNAALEGTKAGEAGKGFALVAAEMRRLAESVMESVAGIRELMQDMRKASHVAAEASEAGSSSSRATARSAREIAMLTQEQRQATEQVMSSMDEMTAILNHTIDAIQRSTGAARDVASLATTLSGMVRPGAARAARELGEGVESDEVRE